MELDKNLWDAAEAVLRRNFWHSKPALEKRNYLNQSSLSLFQGPRKRRAKSSQREQKEGNNKGESRNHWNSNSETIEKINETKSWLFKKESIKLTGL